MKYLKAIVRFLVSHGIAGVTITAEVIETSPRNGFKTRALTGNKTLIISARKRGWVE